WGVQWGVVEQRFRRVVVAVMVVAILVTCAVISRFQVRHWKNSETLFRHALNVTTDNYVAHLNLGVALASQGKIKEAIGQYEQALWIRPDDASAHNNLGSALLRLGRAPEAIGEFTEALRIKPDNAGVHYNLGVALASQGRIVEAIAQYRESLRLRPDLPPALNRLAWILVTNRDSSLRNSSEAVQLAERLHAITGDQQADTFDVLAAAYAEAGRFNDAVQAAQKALDLAMAGGQHELAPNGYSGLAWQIQERLKLYQAGQPFHEGAALTAPE
ncbi:MAG: tetratricopeptide repeat protein, partial [Verrucomicrobiia bacterium]